MQEKISKIKNKSKEIIAYFGYDADPIVTQRDRVIMVNFRIDDPGHMIGKDGEVLDSLQHILRILLKDDLMEDSGLIVIDINGYRTKKTETLEKRARDIAHKVRVEQIEIELPPMNSFDRRIIHTIVTNIADVETESRGDRQDRRVVIKPKKK